MHMHKELGERYPGEVRYTLLGVRQQVSFWARLIHVAAKWMRYNPSIHLSARLTKTGPLSVGGVDKKSKAIPHQGSVTLTRYAIGRASASVNLGTPSLRSCKSDCDITHLSVFQHALHGPEDF